MVFALINVSLLLVRTLDSSIAHQRHGKQLTMNHDLYTIDVFTICLLVRYNNMLVNKSPGIY